MRFKSKGANGRNCYKFLLKTLAFEIKETGKEENECRRGD
jgi:hypothetical protein